MLSKEYIYEYLNNFLKSREHDHGPVMKFEKLQLGCEICLITNFKFLSPNSNNILTDQYSNILCNRCLGENECFCRKIFPCYLPRLTDYIFYEGKELAMLQCFTEKFNLIDENKVLLKNRFDKIESHIQNFRFGIEFWFCENSKICENVPPKITVRIGIIDCDDDEFDRRNLLLPLSKNDEGDYIFLEKGYMTKAAVK